MSYPPQTEPVEEQNAQYRAENEGDNGGSAIKDVRLDRDAFFQQFQLF